MISGLARRYGQYTRRVLDRRPGGLYLYRERLAALVRAGDRVLHLGCGWDRSRVSEVLAPAAEVTGVDLDAAAGARYPGTFVQADAGALPFDDDAFDLACCEYVFEHVADPDAMMAELARVVRPRGAVLALLPNLWSYKAVAARLTPLAFHRLVAGRLRADSRADGDVHATHYRINTRFALHHQAAIHGFTVAGLRHINNGPTWFQRAPGLFELGCMFHAALDRVDGLAGLRCAILVELRRRDPAADAPA